MRDENGKIFTAWNEYPNATHFVLCGSGAKKSPTMAWSRRSLEEAIKFMSIQNGVVSNLTLAAVRRFQAKNGGSCIIWLDELDTLIDPVEPPPLVPLIHPRRTTDTRL